MSVQHFPHDDVEINLVLSGTVTEQNKISQLVNFPKTIPFKHCHQRKNRPRNEASQFLLINVQKYYYSNTAFILHQKKTQKENIHTWKHIVSDSFTIWGKHCTFAHEKS